MQESLFIVWRESVEALLVLGILHAWLQHNSLESQVTRLWIGTGFGILLASILALIFWIAGQLFSGLIGELFFTFMMIFASILILQTVVWMHRHGKNMKKQLELKTAHCIKRSSHSGIMILSMLAVAREGVETVIFLTGIGMQRQGTSLGLFILGGMLGFGLAILTFLFLQRFSHIVPWRWFFSSSTFVLLLIGNTMMVQAFEKGASQLSVYNLPAWMYSFMDDPLWSTQWLITNNNTLASLFGYRSDPSLMQIGVFFLYWITAVTLCSYHGRKI
ncbi:MAG: high-affinity iron transporter [Candidatus Tokpelaia sp. JSC085]|nr:MAG: high-affinity iron transporter [Candidatus Tokpelaia sp. JSC085]